MKLLVAFLAGVAVGCLYPRSSPTSRSENSVEVRCPEPPACNLTCPSQDQMLGKHQDMLIKCYEYVTGMQEKLQTCRSDALSLRSEIEDCRSRNNRDQCPQNSYQNF